MNGTGFVSYRLSDIEAWATKLLDRVSLRFREVFILQSVDNIKPGEDFQIGSQALRYPSP